MSDAHLLVVMGSGETTPTMVTPHQRILARLGDEPRAVLLDTPYGFQENADELTARTQEYFSHNVGTTVEAINLRRVQEMATVEVERAQAAVEDADWLFIGPGSPSYLVDQLSRTAVPRLLRERLTGRGRGVTVVSSAAAATAGARSIPVYEVYKAGHDAHWLEGLDLLGAVGLDAVLVPHFDNAEGGTHDTRYCYLGERRLRMLEQELPDGTWVLGVDEHTAMVIDLTTGAVDVVGRGGVTVRRGAGSTDVVPAGSTTTLDELRALARHRPDETDAAGPADATAGTAGDDDPAAGRGRAEETGGSLDPNAAPLLEAVDEATTSFADATHDADATAATAAVLSLEETVRAWAADTNTGDHLDRAVQALRGLITRLGALADGGMADPATAIAPFVELLLDERAAARDSREWAAADRIRDGLAAGGVELRDGPDGTEWHLVDR